MHIALVGPISTDSIAPFLGEHGGRLPPGYVGAPLMGTLIGELLKRGYQVSAFTTSPGVQLGKNEWVIADGERFRIHYCGLRPHSFRPKHGHLGRASDVFSLERSSLRNAILSAAPDVVHAHWTYEFGLAAIETGLPHVITCHDAPHLVLKYMPNLYRLVRYWMARRCLARANVVTAVSPFLRTEVQPICPATIEVIPNPLPKAVFERDARLNGAAKSIHEPAVAMVMNGWGKLKNPEPALRAFHALRKRLPGAEMHLYGADFGPGERAEQWGRTAGITDGMRFFGKLPHLELLRNLKKADVLLHPSLLESCPMGVAEAMALGLPVVGGTKSGGLPWVVGEGGILVDVTKPQAMADALYRLLDDEGARDRAAREASGRARKLFAVETVADMYEVQYRLALSRQSALGDMRKA